MVVVVGDGTPLGGLGADARRYSCRRHIPPGDQMLMNDGLEIKVQAVFIPRRQLLERDEPVDFAAALTEIRRLTGWGTSDLCFILSVHRSTLHVWETRTGCIPNYEDGRAIMKLLERARNSRKSGT